MTSFQTLFHRLKDELQKSIVGYDELLTDVLVAVFADLLASEMPIVCEVRGTVYVLPNVTRPATLEGKDAARIASEAAWAVFPLVAHGPALPPAAFEERVLFARPFAVKGNLPTL